MRLDEVVLESVKQFLGPMVASTNAFDQEILGHIRVVLLSLSQVGCLSQTASLLNEQTTWSDILLDPPNNDLSAIEAAKTIVCLQVKIFFDPPVSTVTTMMNEEIDELLWRVNVAYSEVSA